MSNASHHAVAVDGQMSRLASEVAVAALQSRRYEKDFLLNIGNPEQQKIYAAEWRAASLELERAIDRYAQAAVLPEDTRQAEEWRGLMLLYQASFDRIEQSVQDGWIDTTQIGYVALDPYRGHLQALTDTAVGVSQRKNQLAQQTDVELAASSTQAITMVLAISIGAVLVAIVWCVFFPAAIMRPVRAIEQAASQLAAGNLAARVSLTRGDELGALARSFDHMASVIQRRTADLAQQHAAAQAAQAEAEAERATVMEQLATIEEQRAVIQEMSVPILPLSDTTLVMPLVGALDTTRLAQVQARAMETLQDSKARHLILDITGVPVVDTQVAQGLLQVIQAAHLLGSQVVLVGIRPEVAQAIVGLGISLGSVVTRSSLQSGISYTLQRSGS